MQCEIPLAELHSFAHIPMLGGVNLNDGYETPSSSVASLILPGVNGQGGWSAENAQNIQTGQNTQNDDVDQSQDVNLLPTLRRQGSLPAGGNSSWHVVALLPVQLPFAAACG